MIDVVPSIEFEAIRVWGATYAGLVLELSAAGGELSGRGRDYLASGGTTAITPIKEAADRVGDLASKLALAEMSGDRTFDDAIRGAAGAWTLGAHMWERVQVAGTDESAAVVSEAAGEVDRAIVFFDRAISRMREVGFDL